MYWSMVEDGIAVIATSLPTLHYFMARKSVQSVVRSVRSILSLRSSTAPSTLTGRASNQTSFTELRNAKTMGMDEASFSVFGMHTGNYTTQITSDPGHTQHSIQPVDSIQVRKDLHQSEDSMV